MTMASHMQSAVVETMRTTIRGRRSDDSFGKEGESLSSLESRAWRILSLYTTVE